MNVHNKNMVMLLLVSTLMLTMFSLTGCKKKSEPAAPAEAKQVVSETIEQTICPVMGGAINKELYTDVKKSLKKSQRSTCQNCRSLTNSRMDNEPEIVS